MNYEVTLPTAIVNTGVIAIPCRRDEGAATIHIVYTSEAAEDAARYADTPYLTLSGTLQAGTFGEPIFWVEAVGTAYFWEKTALETPEPLSIVTRTKKVTSGDRVFYIADSIIESIKIPCKFVSDARGVVKDGMSDYKITKAFLSAEKCFLQGKPAPAIYLIIMEAERV